MATYSEVLDTSFNFENINIFRMIEDETGTLRAYVVRTADGYVMYDTTANDVVYDEEGNEVPVTYYYTYMMCPKTYNFNNFTWVAVPRDSVDENYIFGGGDNDHEIA